MVSNTQNTIKSLVAFFENLKKDGYESVKEDNDLLLIKRDGFLIGRIDCKAGMFFPINNPPEESLPIYYDNTFYLFHPNGQEEPLREALDKFFDQEVKGFIDMINRVFEE